MQINPAFFTKCHEFLFKYWNGTNKFSIHYKKGKIVPEYILILKQNNKSCSDAGFLFLRSINEQWGKMQNGIFFFNAKPMMRPDILSLQRRNQFHYSDEALILSISLITAMLPPIKCLFNKPLRQKRATGTPESLTIED